VTRITLRQEVIGWLSIAAVLTACVTASPTSEAGPVIEAREGTIGIVTLPAPRRTAPAAATGVDALGAPVASTLAPTAPGAPPAATRALDPTLSSGGSTTPLPTAPQPATSTPLPTANLTLPPTITPRSTQASAATPTPSPTGADQSVCRSVSQQTLTSGWTVDAVCLHQSEEDPETWYVFGQVRNVTGADAEAVDVVVTFHDGSGNPITEEGVTTLLAEVVPHSITLPFVISMDSFDPPAQIRFEIYSEPPDPTRTARDDFTVSAQMIRSGEGLTLEGQVTNQGAALGVGEFVDLNATFYNTAGLVVAMGYGYLDSDEMGAGQSADFSITAEGLPEYVTRFAIVALSSSAPEETAAIASRNQTAIHLRR
jgi:hypothetical protein